MHIEITRPDLEALIQNRIRLGGFTSAEDLIFQALREFERNQHPAPSPSSKYANLSELLLQSPLAGAGLDLERSRDYPRSPTVE